MDCSPPGSSMGFPKQEYWSRFPFPSPGDLSNPGIKPRSSSLQVDSLPSEPPGKPRYTGMGKLSLLQEIFWTQESNRGLLLCRWILYQLRYHGSQMFCGAALHLLLCGYRVHIMCIRGRGNQAKTMPPWFESSSSFFHNYCLQSSKDRSIFANHELIGLGIFFYVIESKLLKTMS